MSEAARIQQIEDKLADLVVEADRLAEEPAAAALASKALFDKLRTQARAALAKARSPVKIGVVGEFSAGKTLLLGGLIGYADALPVKEIATTGNVTALRFTAVNEIATTAVGPYRIDFLDHAGFVECLRYMLKEASRRAKSSDLSEDLRERLGLIKADDDQAPSKVDDWARAAWGRTGNPALKYSIRELVRFVRAYMRCGAGLCEVAEPIIVDAKTAVRGLELEPVQDNIQTAAFADIPTPVHTISSRPETLSADQLRDAFPLIRLVTIDVKLSRGVWDFAGLGAERFVLMDFPGLGADSSGVRDLYLCLNELKEIQTLLILLSGRKPGGDQGLKIHSLLQEHREGQDISDMVLVGVGRFDQLPLGAEGEAKLRELAGEASAKKKKRSPFGDDDDDDDDLSAKPAAAGPLTENTLVQALPILGSAVAGAEALVPPGRNDRVVFLSPLLHLKLLEDKNVGLTVGSEEFMANARKDVENALLLRPLWRAVASRLVPSPGAKSKPLLAQWLSDFAEDGGVARLRQLILSHVQGAGFAQLLRDVLRLNETVKQTLLEFRQALPPVVSEGGSKTPEDQLGAAERELRHLAAFYQDKAHRLRKNPRLQITQDNITRPLEDYLNEEVAFRVCDWTQWDVLMQHSENGMIRERKHEAKTRSPFATQDDDDDDEEESDTPFPTRSEDFFAPFETTVTQLEEFTRQLIDRGVAEYLAALGPDVETARLTLGGALERKSLAKEIRALKLGPRGKDLVGYLRVALNPQRLREGLFRTEEMPEDAPPESAKDLALSPTPAGALFPLARSTRDVPGRVFGWAAKFQQAAEDVRPEAHLSHEAMVLRLRDEFIRILQQEMSQQLSKGTQEVLERLRKYQSDMVQGLTVASSNRFVLETILVRQSAGEAAPAAVDALAGFRRLASVNMTT